jgi:hypothetical protein
MDEAQARLEAPAFPSMVRLDADGRPLAYFQDNGYNGDILFQRRLRAFVYLPDELTRQ